MFPQTIRFLSNLFSIKPNEWDGVLYFFFIQLIFSLGASVARSIGMTLLVKNLGGDSLPIIFIFIDLLVMIGSLVYARYTKTVNSISILVFFFIAAALFIAVLQVLIILPVWSESMAWIYGVFFVGFFFFYILISIHIVSVIAAYFTAVQIKRVTGIINAGIPIGGMLGGTVLVVLLNILGVEPHWLIILSGLCCLGGFWLARQINTRLSPVRGAVITNEVSRGTHKNPLREWLSAFRYILSSRLMILMAISLVVFVVGNKMLEYQYQAQIYPKVFPDDTERATFFATYEIFANALWLLVQLFLTSRIVMGLGVGASNLVYPVLSALAALGLFIYFYYESSGGMAPNLTLLMWLGISTQFINQEMRQALRTPAFNMLFNAVPPNQWGLTKAFLNGIVFPLSTIVASTCLLFITSDGVLTSLQQSWLLPLIALIVSIVGVAIAFPQWFTYNEGVFSLLHRDLFNRRELGSGNRGNTLRQVISEKLFSSDMDDIIAALEMIRVLRMNYFTNQVGNLLTNTTFFEIKRQCIQTLVTLPQSSHSLNYLVETLDREQDPKVLPLLLKQLSQFRSINLIEKVEKMQDHPAPEVFVEACLYLHSTPAYSSIKKRQVEEQLLSRLYDSESPYLSLYLYGLGELKRPQYADFVLPFLDHPLPGVALAAFTAFVRMLESRLDPYKAIVLEALNSPAKDMKIAALRALKECHSLENWSPVINLLGNKDRAVVNESKEVLRLSLSACKRELTERLFSPKNSLQERFEILSLIYPKLSEGQHQNLLHDADSALSRFIHVTALLYIHNSIEKPNRAHELISKILQEIAENHLLYILTVITFVANQSPLFFQRVSRGLLSTSRANQGNALEVLSNTGEKYLSNRILYYFDERPTDLASLKRVHHSLFEKLPDLDEDNYAQELLALNNDMLNACLCYIEESQADMRELIKTRQVRVLLDSKLSIHRPGFAYG